MNVYAEVERITRRQARNFAYGIMVLPRPKRQAIAAIYAFARRVDDIADGELPVAEKRAGSSSFDAALDAPPGEDAMLVALADARARYPIPAEALHALVDGGLQDTDRSLRRLRASCTATAARSRARSASRASASTAPTSRERAETLGVALQLINIIRDVREDWELGRVYLPQDELARLRRARGATSPRAASPRSGGR